MAGVNASSVAALAMGLVFSVPVSAENRKYSTCSNNVSIIHQEKCISFQFPKSINVNSGSSRGYLILRGSALNKLIKTNQNIYKIMILTPGNALIHWAKKIDVENIADNRILTKINEGTIRYYGRDMKGSLEIYDIFLIRNINSTVPVLCYKKFKFPKRRCFMSFNIKKCNFDVEIYFSASQILWFHSILFAAKRFVLSSLHQCIRKRGL